MSNQRCRRICKIVPTYNYRSTKNLRPFNIRRHCFGINHFSITLASFERERAPQSCEKNYRQGGLCNQKSGLPKMRSIFRDPTHHETRPAATRSHASPLSLYYFCAFFVDDRFSFNHVIEISPRRDPRNCSCLCILKAASNENI